MSRMLQLEALGASPAEAAELLAYNENVFDLGALTSEVRFPLPDEPFVAFWEAVEREARERAAPSPCCASACRSYGFRSGPGSARRKTTGRPPAAASLSRPCRRRRGSRSRGRRRSRW